MLILKNFKYKHERKRVVKAHKNQNVKNKLMGDDTWVKTDIKKTEENNNENRMKSRQGNKRRKTIYIHISRKDEGKQERRNTYKVIPSKIFSCSSVYKNQ